MTFLYLNTEEPPYLNWCRWRVIRRSMQFLINDWHTQVIYIVEKCTPACEPQSYDQREIMPNLLLSYNCCSLLVNKDYRIFQIQTDEEKFSINKSKITATNNFMFTVPQRNAIFSFWQKTFASTKSFYNIQ